MQRALLAVIDTRMRRSCGNPSDLVALLIERLPQPIHAEAIPGLRAAIERNAMTTDPHPRRARIPGRHAVRLRRHRGAGLERPGWRHIALAQRHERRLDQLVQQPARQHAGQRPASPRSPAATPGPIPRARSGRGQDAQLLVQSGRSHTTTAPGWRRPERCARSKRTGTERRQRSAAEAQRQQRIAEHGRSRSPGDRQEQQNASASHRAAGRQRPGCPARSCAPRGCMVILQQRQRHAGHQFVEAAQRRVIDVACSSARPRGASTSVLPTNSARQHARGHRQASATQAQRSDGGRSAMPSSGAPAAADRTAPRRTATTRAKTRCRD
jgi:hypothetical protein